MPSVASIHAGTTQKEILRALLDAGSSYASRVALFVVKGGSASGWQSRGLGGDDAIKEFSLDMQAGPVAHAYQNRVAAPANIAEMDARFVQQFGGPENEQILVLPLVLKEKVAALLYADGGEQGVLDAPSLEVLVMATSAWLEVSSLRKQVQQRDTLEPAPQVDRPPVAPPPPVAPSFSDPFASHAPKHVAPQAAPEPEPAEVVEVAHAASASAAASAPAAAADPFAGLSAEDADTHRKAQRFARLLVDEIKLYNQAKVAEGRRTRISTIGSRKISIRVVRHSKEIRLHDRRQRRLFPERSGSQLWRKTIFQSWERTSESRTCGERSSQDIRASNVPALK